MTHDLSAPVLLTDESHNLLKQAHTQNIILFTQQINSVLATQAGKMNKFNTVGLTTNCMVSHTPANTKRVFCPTTLTKSSSHLLTTTL